MILNTKHQHCCNCRHYHYDIDTNNVYCGLMLNMVYEQALYEKDIKELIDIESPQDLENCKEVGMLLLGSMEEVAHIPDPYNYVCGNWR